MATGQRGINASQPYIALQSASSLLQELRTENSKWSPLSTGTKSFDDALQGGFEKGKITEVWGPSGSGKTATCLSVTAKLLENAKQATWIGKDGLNIVLDDDTCLQGAACATPLSTVRLDQAIKKNDQSRLGYVNCRSLAQLIAFLQRPQQNDHDTSSNGTDLIIIEDLNMLVDLDYPRQHAFASSSDSANKKWQAGRRSAVLAWCASAMNRLANQHTIAIVVTNRAATMTRNDLGLGSSIVSGLGGREWDAGIWSRVVLLNDFIGRFMALQKLRGSLHNANSFNNSMSVFCISDIGLIEDVKIDHPVQHDLVVLQSSTENVRKRNIIEVADSDDEEEYGWGDISDNDLEDTLA